MMEQSTSGSNTPLRVGIGTDVLRQPVPQCDQLKTTGYVFILVTNRKLRFDHGNLDQGADASQQPGTANCRPGDGERRRGAERFAYSRSCADYRLAARA